MNGRCLLIKRLVQIEIVGINLDFTDCLNASLEQKSTVNSTCLLHIKQHMPNLGVLGGPLKIETGLIWDNLLALEFDHSSQTILRTNNMLSSNAQRMIR